MAEPVPPTRIRDPARKERILAAAADLVARNGYHAVSMADIGAAVGITATSTASPRYWVHLLDELRDDLSDTEARALVNAATGAIQSTLFHNTGLPDDRLRTLLTDVAWSVFRIGQSSGSTGSEQWT